MRAVMCARAAVISAACASLLGVPLIAQRATARDSVKHDSTAKPAQLLSVTITTAPPGRSEPSSSTRLTAASIAATPAATPWELLRQAAGVEVHQQGQGPGFASDAAVRGFSSDHSTDLALWVDGVPINEPVNGHAEGYNDWSVIFPAAIRDIDVRKGPTSALFGNFALAGVVNVRTLERLTGTHLDFTGGSHGRADASLLTGFDHGTDGGVAGLRFAREDGFRPNARNDIVQAHGRFVHDVSPNVSVDAGTELYAANWHSPGFLSESEFAAGDYDVVTNSDDGGFKRRAQERASVRVLLGDNAIWRTTAYATQGRWQLFLTVPPLGGPFEGSGSQTEEEDTRNGAGLTSALTYTAARTDISFGAESRFDHAHYENYFTTRRNRDSADARVTGEQLSGALLVESTTHVSGRLQLAIGARYDGLSTRSTPDSGNATRGGHGVFSPKLGASVSVAHGLCAYVNTSRGFRSADGVLTDPSLVPITVWAYESGLKLDVARTNASIALFRMNVSNEQTFDPITGNSSNGGKSKRQGVELDVHAMPRDGVHVTANWTFNDATYTARVATGDAGTSPPVDLRGLRVYNTARYVGSAAFELGLPNARWSVRVAGNWVGPYSPFDEPDQTFGAFGLMHASAGFRVATATTINIGISNVLDRRYPEVIAGHKVSPGAPRAAYLTLRRVF